SSRRRHTRFSRDWSSDVCSSDLFQLTEYGAFMKLPADQIADNNEHRTEKERDTPAKGIKTFYTHYTLSGKNYSQTNDKRYGGSEIGRASCRERGQMTVYKV